MTKTQIQVSEELLEEIRAFAKRRGWSLAETFRRGAELLLQVYPEKTASPATAWAAPSSSRLGWKGLPGSSAKPPLPTQSRACPERIHLPSPIS